MPVHRFAFPATEVIFGEGAVRTLAQEAGRLGMRAPLLVTGSRPCPVLPGAITFARARPAEESVLDGAELFVEHSCDGVVAVGGGSVLDAAKAIRLKVSHALPLAEYAASSGKITPDMPPMIAVPTIAGAGSEVSEAMMITLERSGRKVRISSPCLAPALAVGDPELSRGAPPAITALSGVTALAACVEAYLAAEGPFIGGALALEGARLAFENLPRAVAAPEDLDARSLLLMASMMGAMAGGWGPAQAAALDLAPTGVPHGAAVAVLLPFFLKAMERESGAREDALARHLGADRLAGAVRGLNTGLGIAPQLRDHGVPLSAVPAAIREAW